MKNNRIAVWTLAVLSACGMVLCGCDKKTEENINSQKEPGTSEIVPGEKILDKIEVTKLPNKVNYEEGDMLDLTGMVVMAVYSDKSTEDITSKCSTTLDGKPLTAANTSFYVVYRYTIDGKNKTKSAIVNITVHAEEVIHPTLEKDLVVTTDMLPHNLVKTSTADMVFWGYYDSTSMKCESILELTKTDETKGTFRFTEMNGISSGTEKLGYINGDYVIDGTKMTLQSKTVKVSANTAKLDEATKEIATITKEGDKIVGLNFGGMSGTDKFWGWSKSKESVFVESGATAHGGKASEMYMDVITDKKLSATMKSYYQVDTLSLAETAKVKTEYYVGDTFEATDVSWVVNYVLPEGSPENGAPYTNQALTANVVCSLSDDHVMTLEDTKVTYTYDGKALEIPLTVNEIPAEKTPKSLKIDVAPTKASYHIGEVFDKTGMVVKAVYTDDSEEVVNDFTVENADKKLTPSDTNVTIKATVEGVELSTTVTITVAYDEPWNVAQASAANYVFAAGHDDLSKTKRCYSSLELTGDLTAGTFAETIRFSTNKWTSGNNYFVFRGTYSIAGNTLKLVPDFVYTDKPATTMFYNPSNTDATKSVTLKDGSYFAATITKTEEAITSITYAQGAASNVVLINNDESEVTGYNFFNFTAQAVDITDTIVKDKKLSDEQTAAIPTLA